MDLEQGRAGHQNSARGINAHMCTTDADPMLWTNHRLLNRVIAHDGVPSGDSDFGPLGLRIQISTSDDVSLSNSSEATINLSVVKSKSFESGPSMPSWRMVEPSH